MNSVTVIIPAYKEEDNIEDAIDNVVKILASVGCDYEVIVVDDGSPDKTGDFARLKAETNSRVRVAINATNEGFGYSFARGVKMATKDFVTVFPGDNDMSPQSLKDLIEARGTADLIISYMKPTNKRSLFRRFVSKCFVFLMNILFQLNLKYYNGAFICRTQLLKTVPIKSMGLAALAECLVRLIKKNISYRPIYFEHTGRRYHQSKAFSLKSVQAVLATIWMLFVDIYIAPQKSS